MGSLRLWVKIVLFLSSYTPLFIIFIFQILSHSFANANTITSFINNDTSYLIYFLIIIVILPNIFVLWYTRSRASIGNSKTITISYKEELNTVYIDYLITYIVPFLSFDYSNIWDVASLLLLLSIICYIYINSNLLYVNIIFNLFGYNLFKIKDANQNEYMLISVNKKILLNNKIKIKSISDNFVIEVKDEFV